MSVSPLRRRRTPLIVAALAVALAYGLAPFAPEFSSWSGDMTLPQIAMSEAVGYLIWAIGFFALFWLVLHPLIRRRQLSRSRWPRLSQVAREIAFSLTSQSIFIAVSLWFSFTNPWGIENAYAEIGDYGWLWWAFTVFAILVVDDTYFYWTHRAMHHPWLFERVHRVHHESVDPTPFTAFSFHPLEALVHGVGSLSILVVVLTLPHHVSALIVAGTAQMLFNVVGHLGYEIYPRGWVRLPLLRWKMPTLHHYMHHQRVGGNYGLYFRWWDRLCGTEFRDFEDRYDRLFTSQADKNRPALDPAE